MICSELQHLGEPFCLELENAMNRMLALLGFAGVLGISSAVGAHELA